MATLSTPLKKPDWLKKKIDLRSSQEVKRLIHDLNLHTVCQQALCPNIGECFKKGHATFLILGRNCTRNCKFCNIENNQPDELDFDEARRVAEAAKRLALNYVVVTSVTRDDLADGGARFFKATVEAIKQNLPSAKIELLIPDFFGKLGSIEAVVSSKPNVIGHNLETVPRMYREVRPKASYNTSLKVLRAIKGMDEGIFTKSALMLGLGEGEKEVLSALEDLRRVDCDFLSLGQYLAPSIKHYPVKEYIALEKFKFFEQEAKKLGFRYVLSAPFVRSSYLASDYLS